MALQLDDYRLLGRSGLRVSPLCLGTMTFGVAADWGSSDEEAQRMLDVFMARGGNFVDTANFYAQGQSERVLAKAIGDRRERLVISTKYTLTMGAGDPNLSGNHRRNMVRSVEASLKRLGTDYIDLLYLHMWDQRTPVEEVLRAFDDLVRAGKILYAGISDSPAWQISRMQAIADLRGWSPYIALQAPYNLTQRGVERELLPMAEEMGIGVLPWGALAGGILSGKYTRDDLAAQAPTSIKSMNTRKDINLATGRLNAASLAIAEEVKAVADEIGRPSAQVALAWTLLNPAVTSPLVGARTLAQLEANLAALEITFTPEQVARLDEVSRIDLGFPHEMMNGPVADQMLGGVRVEKPRPGRR
jgi:aryl-alcohol dehydrogenase-like predicted oxidoreductase